MTGPGSPRLRLLEWFQVVKGHLVEMGQDRCTDRMPVGRYTAEAVLMSFERDALRMKRPGGWPTWRLNAVLKVLAEP